jgi:hypothetical protein
MRHPYPPLLDYYPKINMLANGHIPTGKEPLPYKEGVNDQCISNRL